MKLIYTLLSLCCYFNISAQSNLVGINESVWLNYTADSNGFFIPDFSNAGYRGGGIEIPNVQVVKQIEPIAGDNTAHIQAAIDEVGSKPLNAEGIRGAVLLKAGVYEVWGTLYVKYSGVVLRGLGNTDNSNNATIIYARGNTPHQRDVIVLGNTSQNKWTTKISGTQKDITDNIVPTGARSFSVTSTSPFQVGDLIAIYHPCTENWLEAINYGGVPAPLTGEADGRWTVNQAPILYHRYITKIEGKKLTIDAPVFYTLNKSLSQAYIYKFNASSILKEIAIENLRVKIESAGGVDENHAWQAIRFKSVENCWAKNVVTTGFGQSGFITDCCTRTTIEDCEAVDPVSIITGERRYNFNTYTHSQLILFKNCYAREGRHHFISNGASFASGNVFLNCTSDAVNSVNEGHRLWSQGFLYDNHKEVNLKRAFVLGLYNRVAMGSGHGWAAVSSVLWNCDVSSEGIIGLQKPPTAQNYAIGCTAKSITGKPINDSNFELGYVEATNQPIANIPSLYLAQLKDRLMDTTASLDEHNKTEKPYEVNTLTRGKLTVSFTTLGNIQKEVRLFNTKGQEICAGKTSNSDIEINLPQLSGIYLLHLKIGSDAYCEKYALND